MRLLHVPAAATLLSAASILGVATPAHAASSAGPRVSDFTLINADTDNPMAGHGSLHDHDVLSLSRLASPRLNVLAKAKGAGSVAFAFDGKRIRVQNDAPFALGGDSPRGYLPWTPPAGMHTITATAYSAPNLTGRAGTPRTVTVTVTQSAKAARAGLGVSALALINADTDRPINGYNALADGVTLDFSVLKTKNLNIAAVTSPATVGSVAFTLDGKRVRVQNSAPYTLGGDDGSDYYAWTPSLGTHTLTVTPYSRRNLAGSAGSSRTITFKVINGATAASTPAPATRTPDSVVTSAPAPPTAYDLALRPFGAASPWNTRVSAAASWGSASDARTTALLSTGTYINAGAYSTPVFIATNSDPTRTIRSPQGTIAIHVPASATPANGTDATFTIIDPTHTYVDDFWIYDGNGTAQRHVRSSLGGTGVEGGIRAAGFSAIGGLIRKWEVDAGSIDHAVELTIPAAKAKRGYVAPAISEDAYAGQYGGSIPLGTRFAIPPSVNITTLGLSAPGLMLARAMQTYGAYVGDTSAPGTNGNTILCAEPSLEGTAALNSLRNDLKKIRDQLRPVS